MFNIAIHFPNQISRKVITMSSYALYLKVMIKILEKLMQIDNTLMKILLLKLEIILMKELVLAQFLRIT